MKKKCVHHYLIPGGGKTAIGTCKKCHKEKEFVNVLPEISKGMFLKPDKVMAQAKRDYYMNFFKVE